MRTADSRLPFTHSSTLSDKTNAPTPTMCVGPSSKQTTRGIGLRGVHKAAPTVALTSANVSSAPAHDGSSKTSARSSHNFVPFPSTPDADWALYAFEDTAADPFAGPASSITSAAHVENALKRPLPSQETRRKRCQVPPAQSSHGAAPRRRSVVVASPRPRLATSTAGAPTAKRPKKNKRVVADMQFTADVHRSIMHSMRVDEDCKMAVDGEVDVLLAQDKALVDRLWKSLREQGCSPVLIDGSSSTSKVVKVEAKDGVEADVVMDGVVAESPVVELAPAKSSVVSLPIPPAPTCPPPSPPTVVTCPPAATTPSPSPPRSTPPPSPLSGPRVYRMPQLVATMIMRHRERTVGKGRPPSPTSRGRVKIPSPLSKTTVVLDSTVEHQNP
ncbi:hypothetical protein OF83DRAFT_1168554 [Amylostereum chailletii]|nr:hypothetical protein OF83DRAFT_1168554 [Amylostereum chailletii]